jgi:hypothetical protein
MSIDVFCLPKPMNYGGSAGGAGRCLLSGGARLLAQEIGLATVAAGASVAIPPRVWGSVPGAV